MKRTLFPILLLLSFGYPVLAQTSLTTVTGTAVEAPTGNMTLGGVPALIAQKLQEAKACGIVDLSGHIGGGAYVPTWTFHDMDGVNYVEAIGIGYRALQGSKPTVFIIPFAIDLTALSGRIWNFTWAKNHVTRSKYPDIFVGIGPLLPTDKTQLYRLKLDRPKDWMAASASVRFQ